VALDEEEHKDVLVHGGLKDSYFGGGSGSGSSLLETNLFAMLTKLSERDPFCDIVFCGHSYGGALACLGAVRLAAMHPSMTVSCHSFGASKVGDKSFRSLANSLPNLKIMRIEYGADPYVKMPEVRAVESKSKACWTHSGHTILLTPEETPLGEASSQSSPKSAAVMALNITTTTGPLALNKDNPPALKVLAYKFEDRKPTKAVPWLGLSAQKRKKMKKDHHLTSYVRSLEPFAEGSRPWISHFVGQEGKGIVRGLDKEERLVV
jgi:pimeloyl-ACP methyl ester carboxylesterase